MRPILLNIIAVSLFAIPAHALNSIEFMRVNDPTGLDGFEIKCPSKAQNICKGQTVNANERDDGVSLIGSELGSVVQGFKKSIPAAALASQQDPPSLAEVVLFWKVNWEGQVLKGFIPKNAKNLDPKLLKAVLLFEANLGDLFPSVSTN